MIALDVTLFHRALQVLNLKRDLCAERLDSPANKSIAARLRVELLTYDDERKEINQLLIDSGTSTVLCGDREEELLRKYLQR